MSLPKTQSNLPSPVVPTLDTILSKLNQIDDNTKENELFSHNLDELFENAAFLLSNEKNHLKKNRDALMNEKEEFKNKCQKEIITNLRDNIAWEENLKKAKELEGTENDIYDLNIGGNLLISTTKQTLCKYPTSALTKMFNSKFNMKNNRIFIDRDGQTFKNILYFLRNDKTPKFKSNKEKKLFYEELNYWLIPISKPIPPSVFTFDPEWCAETLNIVGNDKKTISKNTEIHGIVFCNPPMDEEHSYVEFNLKIEIPCKGKSLLFLGLVKRADYRHEQLLSTFWKDSPGSFYWDVWNTKLIKTDDNGVQTGTMLGYGCPCEELEIKFGIRYNAKEKTIEFFKNGINFGIAFRNVPSGLNPSLDIWFEKGKVEILPNTEPQKLVFD